MIKYRPSEARWCRTTLERNCGHSMRGDKPMRARVNLHDTCIVKADAGPEIAKSAASAPADRALLARVGR